MLQTFLPLFLMTFGICLFIVLMQFLWRYIDDMVGKGLGIPVLAEMFMYAALIRAGGARTASEAGRPRHTQHFRYRHGTA